MFPFGEPFLSLCIVLGCTEEGKYRKKTNKHKGNQINFNEKMDA